MDKTVSKTASAASVAALVLGLGLTRLYGHLLFHTVIELSTVAIAWSVFFLAWNTRRILDNHAILLLGISSLFVGSLDAVHAITYKGMGVWHGGTADLPTQMWIAARLVQSASLLLAPLFLRRKFNANLAFGICAAVTAGLFASILTDIFPACYIEGRGLTHFKIGCEYAVTAALLASAVLFLHDRELLDRGVLAQLAGAIVLTAAAELAFTLYFDVYGAANVAGHLLRFVAFWLIYRAILVTGLVRPVDLLFRNLAQREQELEKTNARLESTVADLQRALTEVKTLSGLLPICANCKKIRDDKGYWTQVESYIHMRTKVSFSHGICPDCLSVLYPELYPERDEHPHPADAV